MKLTIYQAGPLFTQAEKDFHRKLQAALEAAGHSVIWPGALLSDAAVAAAGPAAGPLIFKTCLQALHRCNCLVALLDGPQADDGTAWEIGYAHARALPVLGLRTDCRQAGETKFSRLNSMLEHSLHSLSHNTEDLLRQLGRLNAGA